MPLADLSIDDAIALACREVPESAYNISDEQEVLKAALLYPPIERALWFASAWEWLSTFGDGDPFYRVVPFTDGWGVDSVTPLGRGLEATSIVIVRLPTKFHALAAAVLLAAGKVVP